MWLSRDENICSFGNQMIMLEPINRVSFDCQNSKISLVTCYIKESRSAKQSGFLNLNILLFYYYNFPAVRFGINNHFEKEDASRKCRRINTEFRHSN